MAKKQEKFIIDIVPLTRIPLDRNQSFSYLHNEKLSPGTLVSVPLFRRKVEGIVLESKNDFKRLGNIELKKIDRVIEKDFLTENQLQLAQFISNYYISPLGIVLKGFVPKQIKKRILNLEFKILNDREKKKIILTNEQKNVIKAVSDSKFNPPAGGQNSKFLLYGPSGSGKTEVYIHSMLEISKKDPQAQFLVLVPEHTLTPQAIERYGSYFLPEEMAILSSNTRRGQFYEDWRRTKLGEIKIIIATRKGVMAPFRNLRLIVVDEEQDMSYKNWDMNPRYDARTSAERLAEIYKCPIIRGSATPNIESYYRANNKKLILLKLPALNLEVSGSSYLVSGENKNIQDTKYKIQNTIIVDMKKERWAKNYSCISKKLKSEIAYALKNKSQALLFINRQGMSSFSVCQSCKTVLKCPQCERSLVYDRSGQHICIHCSYRSSITPQCEKCGGIIFKNVGLGTQKVEREIINLFPGAVVSRLDSQAVKTAGYQGKIYRDFAENKIDILIGTQMITKGWDFPNLSLAAVVDADNMLSLPDFSAAEKAFQTLCQFSGRVARPESKWPGTVIIQTYDPLNKFWENISEKNYEGFYQGEIKERKMLQLPPFGKLIKLTCQGYRQEKVEKEAQKIYNLLRKSGAIYISPAQDSYVPKIRGRFRKQIILKTTEKWPEKIMKILKSLPSEWIIDVDPISIL